MTILPALLPQSVGATVLTLALPALVASRRRAIAEITLCPHTQVPCSSNDH